jgi:hypothetical protein
MIKPAHAVLNSSLASAFCALLIATSSPADAAPTKKAKGAPAPGESPAADPADEAKPATPASSGADANAGHEGTSTPGSPTTPSAPENDSPDPTSSRAPDAPPNAPPDNGVDTSKLQELDDEAGALQDELLQARTRVALLTSKLYDAKLQVELRSNLERFYTVRDFTVTVDGAPVYHQDEGLGAQAGPLFDLYAAPGSHRVGITAELIAKRNDHYRVHFTQEYTVIVPEASTVRARIKLRETGNMFANFDKRKSGRYDLHARLKVRARVNKNAKRPGARGGASKASATAGAPTAGGAEK